MKSMLEKIERAAVSGRLFKTTRRFLKLKRTAFINNLNPEIWAMNMARKRVCKKTPVSPNKIIFQTFQGDYTCNPKYITEELVKRNPDIDIVWSLRKASLLKSENLPSHVRVVEQFSYEYFREIASAKIWVVNSVEFLKKKIIKKPEQVLIETWHGSLGIKRFSKDVNSGKAWVKAAERCGKWTNYCISNSEFEDNVYKETFWPNSEILQYGHPRNDILLTKDPYRIQMLREKLYDLYEIPPENKLVLYAPTFRDDHQFDCYNIDSIQLLEALKEKFGGEWTFLTRYHPTVRKWAKKRAKGRSESEIDVTTYNDIQELMAVADIAITDYSSWIYDFVLTGRPGFIFATDIKKYNSERGFYYPLESTPFPIAVNNRGLLENIEAFDMEKYTKKVQEFLNDKGCIEDGRASERVVDKILAILEAAK